MIFVTVGTHEQQFNRLVKAVDDLVADGTITEEVIIQKGYTEYEPKHCKAYKLISYKDMQKYYDDARIIITHGGPASFMAALERGKTPIVMPRLKKYDEHVNDHQDYFCRKVEEKYHNIVIVKDATEVAKAILETKNQKNNSRSNNEVFNKALTEAIIKLEEAL